jgi:hypothetical protein
MDNTYRSDKIQKKCVKYRDTLRANLQQPVELQVSFNKGSLDLAPWIICVRSRCVPGGNALQKQN